MCARAAACARECPPAACVLLTGQTLAQGAAAASASGSPSDPTNQATSYTLCDKQTGSNLHTDIFAFAPNWSRGKVSSLERALAPDVPVIRPTIIHYKSHNKRNVIRDVINMTWFPSCRSNPPKRLR
jgi:hypothetical protein